MIVTKQIVLQFIFFGIPFFVLCIYFYIIEQNKKNKHKKIYLQIFTEIEKEFIESNCYFKDFFKTIKKNIKKQKSDVFKKIPNIEVGIYNLLAEFSLNELDNTAYTHIYPGLLTPYGISIAKIYKHCIEYFEKNKIYTEEELKIAKKNLTDRVFNY